MEFQGLAVWDSLAHLCKPLVRALLCCGAISAFEQLKQGCMPLLTQPGLGFLSGDRNV